MVVIIFVCFDREMVMDFIILFYYDIFIFLMKKFDFNEKKFFIFVKLLWWEVNINDIDIFLVWNYFYFFFLMFRIVSMGVICIMFYINMIVVSLV